MYSQKTKILSEYYLSECLFFSIVRRLIDFFVFSAVSNKLKYTDEALQGQIEYLKGERDAVILELSSTKGQMKACRFTYYSPLI